MAKEYLPQSILVMNGRSIFYMPFIKNSPHQLRPSSCFTTRNHVSIWNLIQKYNPKKIITKEKKINEFRVDETLIRVAPKFIWL